MIASEAPIGGLMVRQGVLGEGHQLSVDYDLIISTVSWETRGIISFEQIVGRGTTTVLLRFASTAPEVLASKDAIQSRMEALAPGVKILEMASSVDWSANVPLLNRFFSDEAKTAGRPLRVLMDITCLPKRYLLFLVGKAFKEGLAASLDLTYAEADIYRAAVDIGTSGYVSEGEWQSVQVPYFEPSEFAPAKRDLFISLGAEITNAMPFVERFEPDELRLYTASETPMRLPTFQHGPEHPMKVRLENTPNAYNMSFPLLDAIGVARDILRARKRPTTCFAIGPKTHALALGIAALANDTITVVCRSPGRYLANDVTATGRIYLYRLEDRFDPRAYWPGRDA